ATGLCARSLHDALPISGGGSAGDTHGPGSRLDEAYDRPDERRLTGAVGPEEGDELPGIDRQVDPGEGDLVPVGVSEVVDRKQHRKSSLRLRHEDAGRRAVPVVTPIR